MPFRRVLRGVGAMLRWVRSYRYRGVHEGTLLDVDYIDILFVGLGLFFFLLVLLRR